MIHMLSDLIVASNNLKRQHFCLFFWIFGLPKQHLFRFQICIFVHKRFSQFPNTEMDPLLDTFLKPVTLREWCHTSTHNHSLHLVSLNSLWRVGLGRDLWKRPLMTFVSISSAWNMDWSFVVSTSQRSGSLSSTRRWIQCVTGVERHRWPFYQPWKDQVHFDGLP